MPELPEVQHPIETIKYFSDRLVWGNAGVTLMGC